MKSTLILSGLSVFLSFAFAAPAGDVNAVCECEDLFCIQSFPESCFCANDNKRRCFEKCGGVPPVYGDCGVTAVQARKAVEEPPTCPCEPAICILSFPEGCICQNEAAQKCFEQCGGPEPVPQECTVDSPLTPRLPVPTYKSPTCPCEPVNCTLSFPEGCICQNEAAQTCFEQCGGPKPVPQDCIIDSPLTPRHPDPAPEPQSPATTPYQRCGSRGMASCPTGHRCMDDPFLKICGLACDQPGYCVPEVQCGGFAGLDCPHSTEQCVDDITDDCDPNNGGADCIGICYDASRRG